MKRVLLINFGGGEGEWWPRGIFFQSIFYFLGSEYFKKWFRLNLLTDSSSVFVQFFQFLLSNICFFPSLLVLILRLV